MISAFAAAGALALVGLNLTIPQRVADARSQSANPPMEETKQVQTVPETAKTLVLGGGCFWCVEAIFEDLIGVYKVENGFAGGNDPNPTYEKVVSGRTGAAEVVKIWYDEKQISRDDLLRFFFTTHDPTTLNRQGNDVGTQYRSVIFYEGEEDKALAGRIKEEVSKEKIWPDPIVTTLEPLAHYTTAEEYHQNYFAKYEKASAFERMKMNAGYCQFVIEPKVRKFREKFRDRLRRKSD
jgi:methionine-S-sulfoxide reductase